MARVAFALELGGELGHVRGARALGEALVRRGHAVAYVLSNLHDAGVLAGAPGDVLRVTAGLPGTPPQQPSSYAEILVGCGYGDVATLAPLAQAWRTHLETWKPDLVVEDFAPTALLAARALGLARVAIGTGFCVPPRLTPLPSFRFDADVPHARLAAAEATALAAANGVLRGWGAPPLARLADLLDCDEQLLCTFPELDAYPQRPASGYWGPKFEVARGARVAWPARGGRRIFAYLKPGVPQLDAIIDWLAASPHRVIAFVPGLGEARRARLAGPARQVSPDPVRLDALIADCDLALTSGGGLTAGLATLGVPQLVLPTQYEQYLMARRIEQLGAGIWLGPAAGAPEVAAALAALLGDARYRAAAQAFARRYPTFSPQEQHRRLVLRIEQHARGRAGDAPILAASNNNRGARP